MKNDEENKKDKKIENDIIKEDEEEESSSSNEEEEEGFPHIKIQKSKMSDNKLLIFNLVFNIHNNPQFIYQKNNIYLFKEFKTFFFKKNYF